MCLSVWLVLAGSAQAGPYRPATDDEVLETLPMRLSSRNELRDLRRAAAERPAEPAQAFALVRRYIELGRAESDPRYFGYAEAVLAPWLQPVEPAPQALILSATLHQNRHEFPQALRQLSAALARQPRLAQAWLTRAVILEVQGDYPRALQSCLALARLASALATATCINSALSLSGQAASAFERLAATVNTAGGDEAERQWALTTLAEIAVRLGRIDQAERQFQAALALPPRNAYVLAAYADFLLDQQRHAEVIALLQHETRADTLLLRLALAERQADAPMLAAHVAALQDRFAASRLRGDTTHQADEARFRLHLLNDAAAALALAQANWQVQREPRDARILLEAALAANRPDAARDVAGQLKRTGLEDIRLAELAKQIREGAR